MRGDVLERSKKVEVDVRFGHHARGELAQHVDHLTPQIKNPVNSTSSSFSKEVVRKSHIFIGTFVFIFYYNSESLIHLVLC